jgi:hypothetical protein
VRIDVMPASVHIPRAGRRPRWPAGVSEHARAIGRRSAGFREIGIFVLAYLTYFGVRAVTQGHRDVAVENAYRVWELEQALGIAWEEGAQAVVLGSQTLLDLVNGVYIWGHWPVLIVGGAILFHLSRHHYQHLRDVCLISGGLGLLIFTLFPLAPPRLADLGMLQDTVTLHAETYRQILPPSLVNEYAAMPSFHAGWNLLLGISLFRATRNPALRSFAVLMPGGMAFAVVATANHFVVDVVAGAAIVLVALYLVDHRSRRHAVPTLSRDGDAGAERGSCPALPGRAPGGQ